MIIPSPHNNRDRRFLNDITITWKDLDGRPEFIYAAGPKLHDYLEEMDRRQGGGACEIFELLRGEKRNRGPMTHRFRCPRANSAYH